MNLELGKAHFTPAGLWWVSGADITSPEIRALIDAGQAPDDGRAASFGQRGREQDPRPPRRTTSYTMPTPYLALWTSTVDDTSTAATAGELTYTTYARTGDQLDQHVRRRPRARSTNDVAITFPAVSAGGGTVTFWMLCQLVRGRGRQHLLGHGDQTVITTTQTPPTVAIGGFVINLD